MGEYEPWQVRVIEEADELAIKLAKLAEFGHTEGYERLDSTDKGLLMAQGLIMENYHAVLEHRILRFN